MTLAGRHHFKHSSTSMDGFVLALHLGPESGTAQTVHFPIPIPGTSTQARSFFSLQAAAGALKLMRSFTSNVSGLPYTPYRPGLLRVNVYVCHLSRAGGFPRKMAEARRNKVRDYCQALPLCPVGFSRGCIPTQRQLWLRDKKSVNPQSCNINLPEPV
jgi:hypothetical protein